jgi:hypothetical protein
MTDIIQIPLGNGRTYGIEDKEEMLSALAPAILRHLGCSFEIRWPDKTEEAKRRRESDRKRALRSRRQDAELWAAGRDVLDTSDREYIRDLLVEAYIAGFDAAPKGVNR